MSRPNLLFLTPTLPLTTGTGSSIRAGVTLEALARHFNVYVFHAELWGWLDMFTTDFVKERAARYVCYRPPNGELPMPEIMSEHFAGVRFQAIHTFRLIMARAAVSVLFQSGQPQPHAVIDLDDDECHRSERFLELREAAGESQRAQQERRELPALRTLERMFVPRFQAICLAAREDCERVSQRYPGRRFAQLPNAIFPRPGLPAHGYSARVPTLLFVGKLDYLPNEDGVRHFCAEILPLLQKASGPLRIRLVGANPTPGVKALVRHPYVEVLGDVPDLTPYYADADVVIVPLRAGSGTRIKILEAFTFRRPVVSTTIGATGLDLTSGKQLLLADEPQQFANACVRLMGDATLRGDITESAWRWLQANHSIDSVDAVIQSLYAPVLEGVGRSPGAI
jgi:glycosyltransferase involved in cell wall biosynthesis